MIKKTIAKHNQPVKEKLDQWCRKQHLWIMVAIVVFSVLLRIVYYQQCNSTCFINEHANPESDMSFFDEGANKIADGDILSKTVHHPQHQWMQLVADRYFQSHPDKLEQFRAKIGNDTLVNSPSKMLWNQWYGELTFQQEPLYPYFVALNYAIFGKNVHWVFIFQLLLGVLTNLLVFFVTRRYFGELTATIAAFLAVFCGPMLFYEMVLLRSSIAVFLGILVIYLTGEAIRKDKLLWWIITGLTTGLALLVHSFFILYILGMISVVLLTNRKKIQTGLKCSAAIILGLFLAISPAVYRNYTVGAPAMSLSSTSALSFVTMNNESFKSFIGWNMNTQYLADIMAEADGKLLKTIIPTLKTHPSAGSYLSQVWDKLHATFSWYEIPNNVNFYLYREYIPVLFFTFISFLILSPLAITGIFLSFYKRIHAWPLYLMFLVYLFPMLAFMVLSRYRIIFVPVLIPFAALTVTELLGTWKGWKNYVIILALLILGFWAATPGSEKVSKITKNDYAGIWGVHFARNINARLANQQWDTVAASLRDFLSLYEPGEIKNAKPTYLCRDRNESEVFSYFSMMHSNLSSLYYNMKDSANVRPEREIAEKLKNIADRNR